MIKKYFFPTLALTFILTACSNDKAKSDKLIEANKAHLESVAIHENVETGLHVMKKLAETKRDSLRLQKLDSLQDLIELWEEGMIEVPGFEHEHHHEKGGHHSHKPAPQMTDESMLEYQLNAKAAIEALQKDLKTI
jgi:hypothetical protein